MTEQELIQGCIREKKKYQKELFRMYAGKMHMVCRRYARYPEEADDILQEGFIKVFDNIARFRAEGSLEGWIRRIMINTALKYYRKSCFTKEQAGLEPYHDNGTLPEVYSQMSEQELLKLIAELPDGYRVVFNLYIIEGYSHKEIGEMLEIAASTSRSQLVKARQVLQEKILKLYPTYLGIN